MKEWIKENQKSLIIALIVLFAVLVAQSILKQVFDNHIFQYLSMIANNSWQIQVLLCGLLGLIYCYSFVKSSTLYNGCEIIPSRIIWTAILLILYLFFRLTYQSEYIFYGLDCFGSICYTDVCVILVVIVEFILGIKRYNNNTTKSKDEQNIQCQSFLPDIPTDKDLMNRGDYVIGLLNKIIASYSNDVTKNHSFTILLNEKYGVGKTTFMLNLKDRIKSNEAYVIDFKPWLCPNSQQMAIELLNLFVENKIPVKERLFTKYAQALANENSWIGVASRFILNSTTTSLSKHFEDIAEDMRSLKKPIIVLVDDVDRLSEDELMELIKLIRNTAAFPNVFYIVAADKGYLCHALANKGINEPDIFMQKFFNFEMTFPKDDFCLVDMLKNTLLAIVKDEKCVDIFTTKSSVKNILHTPRDVYRYCNMLSYEMDLLKESGVLSEINIMDLMLLTLLHYVSDEVYKLLRDNDERLLKIELGNVSLNENLRDVVIARDKILAELSAKYANQPVPKEICTTLEDAINRSIFTKEKMILDLLYDLFPDSSNYNIYSISKDGEYFKYFSGRNARYEVMGADVKRIINLPKNEFCKEFDKICSDRKFENFQSKLLRYLRCEDTNNIDVFKNLVYVWQYIKLLPENKGYSNDEIFSFDMLSMSYECFCIKSTSEDDFILNDIKLQIEEWLRTEEDLEYLALVLYHIISVPNSQIRMILSNTEIRNYSEKLIERFINEQMSKAPFAENIIKQYYSFGMLIWYNRLKEYIKTLTEEQRNEWQRRVIYKDQENNWQWNKKLIKGITSQHGYFLNTYFDELGFRFDDKLQTALNKVNLHSSVENQKNNEFVKYILSLYE